MSTTITAGSTTITPTLALLPAHDRRRAAASIAHEPIAGPMQYTLRTARPAAGTLQLLFTSEARAIQCLNAHAAARVFAIASDERDGLNFSYVVVGGEVSIALDTQTADHWTVSVPYQQVTA